MFPRMGASTAISAMLTFEACLNRSQRVIFFVFPMRIGFIVALLVLQSLFLDPLHRNIGGILAGGVAFALFRGNMFWQWCIHTVLINLFIMDSEC
jgi:membrane associated rhomboid family serine protease